MIKKIISSDKFVLLPALAGFLLLIAGTIAFAADEGPEKCKDCHEDRYESYSKSLHGIKGDPRTPAARLGCETCHGPGDDHVKAGGGKGVGGIMPLGPKSATPAAQRNAVCLGCHEKGKQVMWQGGVHELRGLSCSNCHSIHGGHQKSLSKPTEPETCSNCHKDIRALLLKSSHHPIREGKLKCSDCHNPHGTIADKLVSANSLNEKCYECHTEKRGPFLWEHAPATENCAACHNPHGSAHDKLLVAKRPYLCQQCHSNSRHPGTLYGLNAATVTEDGNVFQLSSNRLFDRSCQNCHSQIHGSNHPSGKSLLR